MSVTAVFAHYDTSGQFDPVFLRVINALAKHCRDVVVVSTAPPSGDSSLPCSVNFIRRPNVGYDFVSYGSGISFAGPPETPFGEFELRRLR